MSKEDAPLSDEAKAFVAKCFKCTPPCDSYGFCSDCYEQVNFQAGYNIGYRAQAERVSQLEAVITGIADLMRAWELDQYNKHHDRYCGRPHRDDLCSHEGSEFIRALLKSRQDSAPLFKDEKLTQEDIALLRMAKPKSVQASDNGGSTVTNPGASNCQAETAPANSPTTQLCDSRSSEVRALGQGELSREQRTHQDRMPGNAPEVGGSSPSGSLQPTAQDGDK